MVNKATAFATVYTNQKWQFERFRTAFDSKKIKPYSPKRISDLNTAFNQKVKIRDSLLSYLQNWRRDYDSVIISLELNIWPRVIAHDSIIKPFEKCINGRMNFFDNYKKKIVDIRKRIPDLERIYGENITGIIYDRSSKCESLFNLITSTVKQKNALNRDLLKLKLELTKAGEFSSNDLEQFKSDIIESSKEDYCWLRRNYGYEFSTVMGFEQLWFKQSWGVKIVLAENAIERKRHSILNKALKQGYNSSVKSLSTHLTLVKKKRKEITRNRNLCSDPLKFDLLKYSKSVERIEKLFELKDTY